MTDETLSPEAALATTVDEVPTAKTGEEINATVDVKPASQAGEGTDDLVQNDLSDADAAALIESVQPKPTVIADPALAGSDDTVEAAEQEATARKFSSEDEFIAWCTNLEERLAKVESDLGTALENLGHVLAADFKAVWLKVTKFAPFKI